MRSMKRGNILFLIVVLLSISLKISFALTTISSCAVLNKEGETYVLTADIINSSAAYCIDIQANNIILDCQDHLIDGDDSANYGIYIYRSSTQTTNITIKNCRLSDWNVGIYLENSLNNLILGCNVSFNKIIGIWIHIKANNNTVKDCFITGIGINITWAGIYLQNNTNNKIINCEITHSGSGIYFYADANNNTVSNCTISHSGEGIILNLAHFNRLSNLTLHSNTRGIYLDGGASSNTIKNSKIYGNSDCGICLYTWAGLHGANIIYNNFFNNTDNADFGESEPNYWNTTSSTGKNILGRENIGGNFYANPDGNGYSEVCEDSNEDGFCDYPYDVRKNALCIAGVNCSENTDYLPLSASTLFSGCPKASIDTYFVVLEVGEVKEIKLVLKNKANVAQRVNVTLKRIGRVGAKLVAPSSQIIIPPRSGDAYSIKIYGFMVDNDAELIVEVTPENPHCSKKEFTVDVVVTTPPQGIFKMRTASDINIIFMLQALFVALAFLRRMISYGGKRVS